MMTTIATERGCGQRTKGGLYICVGLSRNGLPIEHFIVDPPIPWGEGHFQGARMRERKDNAGIWDILMWVGAENYVTAPDFVEEARLFGVSKRVPGNLDFSMLTPYTSRIILVHPKVMTDAPYNLQKLRSGCVPRIDRINKEPRRNCDHKTMREEGDPQCTFALWDMSAATPNSKKHGVELDTPDNGVAQITVPATGYMVMIPKDDFSEPEYRPGIFLAIPFTHFEFIGKEVPDKFKVGNNTIIPMEE